MIEAWFTKGKWQLILGKDREILMDGNSEMCDQDFHPYCPSNEYDWHLIAAAPDMYNKLQALVGSGNLQGQVEREVLELLAKARGESV